MSDETEPKSKFEDFTDEELVAHFKDQVADGKLPFQLIFQVEDRGIECLDSDPDMQERVRVAMEASEKKFAGAASKINTTIFGVADPVGGKMLDGLGQSTAQSVADKMGVVDAFKAGLSNSSSLANIVGQSNDYKFAFEDQVRPTDFDDELLEAMRQNSPGALNGKLIHSIEIGFGSIQEELAAQRQTLEEQRDVQHEMKSSLSTIKQNSPKSWTTWVILVTSFFAAFAGVAQLFR